MGARSGELIWRIARGFGLLAVAALLTGLAMWPEPTLPVFWNVVFPIIPATLLVSPLLWRNVCPLATLNMMTNAEPTGRVPGPAGLRASRALGIGLLITLIPARHFALNTEALALAGLTVLIAVAALIGGRRFDLRAGFCNTWCPVLPVERLYGQSPLMQVGHIRCRTCTTCTTACIDVAPAKSIAQVLGRSRHSAAWLLTPFGVFAAGFPGLVVGYFLASDGPLSSVPAVYATVLGAAGTSYVIVALMTRAFRIAPGRAMPVLGALAVGLYYWFVATGMAETLGLQAGSANVIRTAAFVLIGAWTVRALAHPSVTDRNGGQPWTAADR
jgi:hypothetical protein